VLLAQPASPGKQSRRRSQRNDFFADNHLPDDDTIPDEEDEQQDEGDEGGAKMLGDLLEREMSAVAAEVRDHFEPERTISTTTQKNSSSSGGEGSGGGREGDDDEGDMMSIPLETARLRSGVSALELYRRTDAELHKRRHRAFGPGSFFAEGEHEMPLPPTPRAEDNKEVNLPRSSSEFLDDMDCDCDEDVFVANDEEGSAGLLPQSGSAKRPVSGFFANSGENSGATEETNPKSGGDEPKEERAGGVEGDRVQTVPTKCTVSCWFTQKFPLSVRRFLPVLDLLAERNPAVSKITEFLRSSEFLRSFATLGRAGSVSTNESSGSAAPGAASNNAPAEWFPIKISLPLNFALAGTLSVAKFVPWEQDGERSVNACFDETVFDVPHGYSEAERKIFKPVMEEETTGKGAENNRYSTKKRRKKTTKRMLLANLYR
jgi:hypothetical protein